MPDNQGFAFAETIYDPVETGAQGFTEQRLRADTVHITQGDPWAGSYRSHLERADAEYLHDGAVLVCAKCSSPAVSDAYEPEVRVRTVAAPDTPPVPTVISPASTIICSSLARRYGGSTYPGGSRTRMTNGPWLNGSPEITANLAPGGIPGGASCQALSSSG